MHNELTKEDIKKMQEELDYRRLELMAILHKSGHRKNECRRGEIAAVYGGSYAEENV